MEWFAYIIGGLLGSAHCIGMCGGIALTVGGVAVTQSSLLSRQACYSAGRVTTYVFLGAIAGFAGLYLRSAGPLLARSQQWFSILAGILMIAVGLSLLGVRFFPRRQQPATSCQSNASCSGVAALFQTYMLRHGNLGPFLAGIATGFLPCGLVYAFLARSIGTANVLHGAAVMALFGLGTIPAMFAVGCSGGLLSCQLRSKLFKAAAIFVIFVGGTTVVRGIQTSNKPSCCDESASAIVATVDALSPPLMPPTTTTADQPQPPTPPCCTTTK